MSLDEGWLADADAADAEGWGLVIAWSFEEPGRVGEVAWIPDRGAVRVLGRGAEAPEGGGLRLDWMRQRPGRNVPTAPLAARRISRAQLELEPRPSGLRVRSVGRCPMAVNGSPTDEAVLRDGDTVHLRNQLLLLVTRRPARLPAAGSWPSGSTPAFGHADPLGMVGEGPATWRLRERLGFLAPRPAHVLVIGPSGVGKELAARALHALSPRAARPLVSRNAATFPPGLIDAELFGNPRDYPNPGMRERRGLVGEADGGTLFLDEIGELPEDLQAHLLRVLDHGGEYQRLGESHARRADLRLIVATNRGLDGLKHDLAARLALRLELDGLDARRDDIPLLARHILAATAAADPAIGRRFFEGWGTPAATARVAPDLMDLLVRHRYSHHVRELHGLLWRAMSTSAGGVLKATPEVRAELDTGAADAREPESVTADDIRAALAAADGNRTHAAAALGLKNRDVLYRLMKKLDVA